MGLLNPEFDRGDLVCKHLTEDNLCSIYDKRPAICDTSTIEFEDEAMAKACQYLRQRTGDCQ